MRATFCSFKPADLRPQNVWAFFSFGRKLTVCDTTLGILALRFSVLVYYREYDCESSADTDSGLHLEAAAVLR